MSFVVVSFFIQARPESRAVKVFFCEHPMPNTNVIFGTLLKVAYQNLTYERSK